MPVNPHGLLADQEYLDAIKCPHPHLSKESLDNPKRHHIQTPLSRSHRLRYRHRIPHYQVHRQCEY